jgi:hypothetical protein
MAASVQTKKGTLLPLIDLKGKSYLMVAYRLQWLHEDVEQYHISTELLEVNEEYTLCRALVRIFDSEGHVVRSATATKRETRRDFSDHTEKAETAAIGRCLSMLGFGTQHALSDLDEGARIVDSPLPEVDETKTTFQKKKFSPPKKTDEPSGF